MFLYCAMDFASNNLMGSSSPPFLFSSTMGSILGWREKLSSRETSLRPNSLYLDLIGDMHKKRKGVAYYDTTDPDYFENEMTQRYNNEIYKDIARFT